MFDDYYLSNPYVNNKIAIIRLRTPKIRPQTLFAFTNFLQPTACESDSFAPVSSLLDKTTPISTPLSSPPSRKTVLLEMPMKRIIKIKINRKQKSDESLFEIFLMAFQLYAKKEMKDPMRPMMMVSVPIKEGGRTSTAPKSTPPSPESSPIAKQLEIKSTHLAKS